MEEKDIPSYKLRSVHERKVLYQLNILHLVKSLLVGITSTHESSIVREILLPDQKEHVERTDCIARSGRVEGGEWCDGEWIWT